MLYCQTSKSFKVLVPNLVEWNKDLVQEVINASVKAHSLSFHELHKKTQQESQH